MNDLDSNLHFEMSIGRIGLIAVNKKRSKLLAKNDRLRGFKSKSEVNKWLKLFSNKFTFLFFHRFCDGIQSHGNLTGVFILMTYDG